MFNQQFKLRYPDPTEEDWDLFVQKQKFNDLWSSFETKSGTRLMSVYIAFTCTVWTGEKRINGM